MVQTGVAQTASQDEIAAAPTNPILQWTLIASTGLVFVAFVQLFLFTEHTDRFFAWTIKSYQTAAFLGAGYLAAVALVGSATLQRSWAAARTGVLAIAVFTAFTGIFSLVHVDRFHLFVPDATAQLAAWAWLVVYVATPFLYAIGLGIQTGLWASPAGAQAELPSGLRTALWVQACTMFAIGTALLIYPSGVAAIWPWDLTPLTGRAVGAWMFAFGIFAVEAAREKAAYLLFRPFAAYALLGVAQLVAVARYHDQLHWSGPSAWLYVAMVGVVLVTGIWGAASLGAARAPERG